MIINEIKKAAPHGTIIPKPRSTETRIVQWYVNSDGRVMVDYSMPNHSDPKNPHIKTITEEELIASYNILTTNGELRTTWYKEQFTDIYRNQPCNFTTIGGMFVLIRKAKYFKRGLYKKTIKDE